MLQSDSIRKIKGIGEQAEKKFHKLNIETVGDLLEHYPREYDIFRPISKISMLQEGEVSAVEGCLKGSPSVKRVRQLKILSIVLEDGSGRLPVTWFNMPYLLSRLRMGNSYILRGKVIRKNGILMMEQPKIYTKEEFLKNAKLVRNNTPKDKINKLDKILSIMLTKQIGEEEGLKFLEELKRSF